MTHPSVIHDAFYKEPFHSTGIVLSFVTSDFKLAWRFVRLVLAGFFLLVQDVIFP